MPQLIGSISVKSGRPARRMRTEPEVHKARHIIIIYQVHCTMDMKPGHPARWDENGARDA